MRLRHQKLGNRLAALLIASATFAACSSSDDSIVEPQQPAAQTDEPKTYTMTVEASMGENEATTRYLILGNDNLLEWWTKGDVVNVYTKRTITTQSNTRDGNSESGSSSEGGGGETGGGDAPSPGGTTVLTFYDKVGTLYATNVSDDKTTATLTGSLTLSGEKKTLYFYYGTASYDYSSQRGTFLYLYDKQHDRAQACLGTTEYNIEDDKITTSGALDFKNQQAIVKFSIKDQNGKAIKVNNLSITTTDELNKFDVAYDAETGVKTKSNSISVNLSQENDVVFVAMPNFHLIGGTISIESNSSSIHYYNTKSYSISQPVTFEIGKYYQVTVKMKRIIDMSKVDQQHDITAINYDVLKGELPYGRNVDIPNNCSVTLSNATIKSTHGAGITCDGNATIILDGVNNVSNINNSYPAIQLKGGSDKTLTIKGNGELTATGGTNSAGIGSSKDDPCGNITIESGTIKAYGGSNGAGIGGGYSDCGNISINGGYVEAQGGDFSAGIGGSSEKTCGKINLANCTVIAIGGKNYAGIGTGNRGECGDITISGCNITATGGQYGAGIGSGIGATCGNISISKSTIKATGGEYAAGIGSGGTENDNIKCGDIIINSGTIEAAGGIDAAGIGSGSRGECGYITISSGVTKVTASKGEVATNSIGAGRYGTCGTVTIGGTVYWDETTQGSGTYEYKGDGATYLTTCPLIYPAQ